MVGRARLCIVVSLARPQADGRDRLAMPAAAERGACVRCSMHYWAPSVPVGRKRSLRTQPMTGSPFGLVNMTEVQSLNFE